ncbi:pectate lyase [Pseudoxanthomonas sangjuensis]|uniref:pectate lyase family protein n=1 Tax=Pseudoxanthomonas sangjuensis TaxID=1503750 RepID=UPI00139087EA|nr:pectate lyase [Pseudoxanthomonas sangjuensis]KAF1714090.1 pectate lyase [Pseudoxanthomonas sangjuensis]
MQRLHYRVLPVLVACALPLPAAAADLGREPLPANDGWASLPTTALPDGTTGGSAATADRVHRVRDRNGLVAALAFPDATPKIIEIEGVIDANVDADGHPLACADYARPDPQTGEIYSLDAYLAAYDPATWGRADPSGPQERARAASASAQQSRVRIRIPANTTIVGVGRGATVRGAWFDIRPSSTSGNTPMNVIVRNLNFEDTFDCFPQWDPTDGALGNWNSQYDAISVRNATHVWIDHNRFADVATADGTLPTLFGRHYQVHDGLLDVTNASDLVTISWNRFEHHDKTMLVGSSDSASADRDKLRITLHHNLFEDLGQRAPRVRYGRVHVYNNHYKVTGPEAAAGYGYSWGVGVESQIVARNNHFRVDGLVPPEFFIDRFNGSRIHVEGTLLDGVSPNSAVDPVAAFNAANGDALVDDVDWAPTLHGPIEPTKDVPVSVIRGAGPFK